VKVKVPMSKRKLPQDSSNSFKESLSSKLPPIYQQCRRLGFADFNKPCIDLAQFLIGRVLCRRVSGEILRGKIVEVESYLGDKDGASHSFKGETERNRAMFMPPGTSYVYSIYGMYKCFNISSDGTGAAVLIRALEPFTGIDIMKNNREIMRKNNSEIKKLKDLCNGPSKLCQAMEITKDLNCADLVVSDELWLETDDNDIDDKIVNTTRIGIGGHDKKWSELKLRWYILGNNCVSVRDKASETVLN